MLELLGGGGLSLGVQILNLGLAEDAATPVSMTTVEENLFESLHPGVATGRLVDVRVVDDEENLARKKTDQRTGLWETKLHQIFSRDRDGVPNDCFSLGN